MTLSCSSPLTLSPSGRGVGYVATGKSLHAPLSSTSSAADLGARLSNSSDLPHSFVRPLNANLVSSIEQNPGYQSLSRTFANRGMG